MRKVNRKKGISYFFLLKSLPFSKKDENPHLFSFPSRPMLVTSKTLPYAWVFSFDYVFHFTAAGFSFHYGSCFIIKKSWFNSDSASISDIISGGRAIKEDVTEGLVLFPIFGPFFFLIQDHQERCLFHGCYSISHYSMFKFNPWMVLKYKTTSIFIY